MGYIEAMILGLIQGLTEFLPISSSAHLRIAGIFLPGATDPGATFTAITQLGTEFAVILYFRKDIVRIMGRWFRQFSFSSASRALAVGSHDPDVRLGWLIIIGTLPIVVIGFLAQDTIRTVFRSLWIIAIVLILFGIVLGLVDYFGKKIRPIEEMTYRHGIAIGVAQMLALVPGVSRSGATMTMGLALGYTRTAAARYGFLLAIPAVFGSGLYELVHSFGEPEGVYGYAETLIATLVAFLVGYAVIAFLMRYIAQRSFLPFVIYRVLLGITLLVLLSFNIIEPV
ncbi:MAG: undecaprenyl-diphosphate phosphatase [Rhodoglobus sp.]